MGKDLLIFGKKTEDLNVDILSHVGLQMQHQVPN